MMRALVSLKDSLAKHLRAPANETDQPDDQMEATQNKGRADNNVGASGADAEAYVAAAGLAVANMKATAKWTVGAFAALAAVLIAGTQLSSLGKLEGSEWVEDQRLWVALGSGGIALIAIGVIIGRALSVLAASPKTLADVEKEEQGQRRKEGGNEGDGRVTEPPKDVAFLYAHDFLKPNESVSLFAKRHRETLIKVEAAETLYHDALSQSNGPKAEQYKQAYEKANKELLYLNDQVRMIDAGLEKEATRRAFKTSKVWMLVAGLVGGIAIAIFSWAANPPDQQPTQGPFLTPASTIVTLNGANRERYAEALGKGCFKQPEYPEGTFLAIATRLTDEEATVISIGPVCNVIEMELSRAEVRPARDWFGTNAYASPALAATASPVASP